MPRFAHSRTTPALSSLRCSNLANGTTAAACGRRASHWSGAEWRWPGTWYRQDQGGRCWGRWVLWDIRFVGAVMLFERMIGPDLQGLQKARYFFLADLSSLASDFSVAAKLQKRSWFLWRGKRPHHMWTADPGTISPSDVLMRKKRCLRSWNAVPGWSFLQLQS